MYFDPKPKKRKEDLYDREKELEEFEKSLKTSPLTVVTGIRRLGKTSLILVGLSDKPSVVVDLRGVPQSREGLYRRIEFAMNEFFKRHKNFMVFHQLTIQSPFTNLNIQNKQLSCLLF